MKKKIHKLLEDIQKMVEQDTEIDPQYEEHKRDISKFYGEHPDCFTKIQKVAPGTGTYILPICNRAGIEDPTAINFSMKVVRSLIALGSQEFDTNELNSQLNYLQHKNNTLAKNTGAQAQAADELRRNLISKIMGYFEIKN